MAVEHLKRSFEEALAHLDVGHKELLDGMLYLAQESGTTFGAVPFTFEGTVISGPDGTQFDLAAMEYHGEGGLYAYLQRQSGTTGVRTWESGGQA
jgi:hypothetical protein